MTGTRRGGDLTHLPEAILRVLNTATSISDEEALRRERAAERLAADSRRAEWVGAFERAVKVRAKAAVLRGVDDRLAIQSVNRWLTGTEKPNLMLRGNPRTGKTVGAAYAVWRWLEPVKPRGQALFLNPDQVISAMVHDYDQHSPRLDGVTLVVVDDIGCETRPGFGEAWRRLLDYADVSLVMTTNLTKPEMRERYPDRRLLRRLLETTRAIDLPDVNVPDLPEDGDF